VSEKFDVRFLDRIRVPGKAKPVKVYELLSEKGGLSLEWQTAQPLYHEAIELFIHRDFARAKQKFLEVASILGQDKASLTYAHRADEFMVHAPADDWDGVFEVKSK
jgi:adenylate cyclase